uniref:hypothetical protein n=1 Tax=Burkholderia pseudomallei TaxID=28450 RepID=UPI0009B26AA7|nr:hypothetical protein [Burkholderia pseudomallei]
MVTASALPLHTPSSPAPYGILAWRYTGKRLPLRVLHSVAGYYLGTADDEGPVSRESVEHFPSRHAAEDALANTCWNQRCTP